MPLRGIVGGYYRSCLEITGTARLKEEHALPKIRQRIHTGTWKQTVKRSNHELVATVQAARAATRAR
jgi:hypothetical protein